LKRQHGASGDGEVRIAGKTKQQALGTSPNSSRTKTTSNQVKCEIK